MGKAPTPPQQLSCCIVGETSLAIQCAELLLEKKYKITGIISPNSQVQEWADLHQITCVESLEDIKSQLQTAKFDYLFSIVNSRILPDWLLSLPQKLSINYHDALLPKFAGVHATSWAIFKNRKKHGITWHVMSSQLDAGDILKQASVSIEPDETALTLNLKCYEAALRVFAELTDELARDTIVRQPQNLKQRTYYGLNQKMPGNGLLNWEKPAQEIDRIYRSLTLGHYTNHLGTPKCVLGNLVFVITKLSVLAIESTASPGTVVNINQDGIQVATGTTDILISEVHNIDGPLYEHGIKAGDALLIPPYKFSSSLKRLSERIAPQELFWVDQLQNVKPATLPFLPNDFKKIDINTPPVHFCTIEFPELLCKELCKVFRFERSFSNIVLAAWMIYLFRINRQEKTELISIYFSDIGLVAKNKQYVNFISTALPLSIELNDDMEFNDVLSEIRDKRFLLKKKCFYLQDVFLRYPELQDVPRCRIITALQDPVVYESHAVYFILAGSGRTAKILIDPRVLNPHLETVLNNIAGHLCTLLESLTLNLGTKKPISTLPLLTSFESQKILIDWNKTHTDYPRDKTVTQLFEEQVEKTPNNIAVVFEDKQLTYRELNQKANQLAHYLLSKGIKTDMRVAICLKRSIDLIISMLAVMKVGGVYIPIDPDYPEARIQYMLQDSQVQFILTKNNILNLTSIEVNSIIILLDKEISAIQTELYANLNCIVRADDLIYIMYTSGSTGKPKGIEIAHRGIVRLVKVTNYIEIQEIDHFAHAINPVFDVSAFEIWGALLHGARAIIFSEDTVLDSELFVKKLQEYQITVMVLTATVFNQLVYTSLKFLDTMRYVLVGGERLTPGIIEKALRSKKSFTTLLNAYGPTENSVFTTCYKIESISEFSNSIPIGKPISNTFVYVMDRNRQLLPLGAIGELYIGGDGLARGYVNKPAFENSLYQSGDLVRWLTDGNLEYIGRLDEQVKVKGFRIELQEIENNLLKHPQITQAVALLADTDICQHKQLVAFIVKNKSNSVSSQFITNFLKQHLPYFMIPIVHKVEALPLTRNGKIDRIQLIKRHEHMRSVNTPLISTHPENEKQLALQRIFCEIFKKENVGIHDDFFDLGGDSISGAQIVAKAAIAELPLTIKQVFKYPTIAQLSTQINCIYPLTPLQNGLLFHTVSAPGSEAYTIQLTWKLAKNIKIPLLSHALHLLVQRYPILRSYFQWQGKVDPVRIEQETTLIKWQEYDWRGVSKAEQPMHLDMFLKADRQAGFTLVQPPLLRITLIQLSDQEYQIVVAMHHIVVDGWSSMIMLKEWGNIYQALGNEQSLSLSPPLNFEHYVAWLNSKNDNGSRAFWKKYLKDFITPTSIVAPGVKIHRENKYLPDPATEQTILSEELTNRFYAFCRKYKLTTSTVLQGIWGLLLGYYNQSEDVVFGLAVSGRSPELAGAEDMVGLLVNTIPLRIKINAYLSGFEYFQNLQSDFLDLIEYEHTPLANIQALSDIPSGINLFETILTIENYPTSTIPEFDIDFRDIKIIGYTHYPLACSVVVGNQLTVKFDYDTHRISYDAIQLLAGHMETLLEALITQPEIKLQHLNFLTQKERQKILYDWNKTRLEYVLDQTIPQVFQEQVDKNPDNIALIFGNEKISYKNLNEKANQIAHYLCAKGISEGTLVAICVERSLSMVIGLLGILKAGCAYVPIDPGFPKKRIQYILENCEAPVLLAHSDVAKIIDEHWAQKIKIIQLDRDQELIDKASTNNLPVFNANRLAYIIYTSGSTGNPKGVLVEHKNVVRLFSGTQKVFDFDENDIWTLFHSFNFDFSVWEIFGALLHGGQLVIVPKLVAQSAEDFYRLLVREQVTVLSLTPAVFYKLMKVDHLYREKLSLHTLLFGGEAMPMSALLPWFELHNEHTTKLVHVYGITETTVYVTYYPVDRNKAMNEPYSVIGKPFPDRQVYVLDPYLRSLPVNIVGELYVGGGGVTRGYLKQDTLTAQRFIQNPFSQNSELLYRTGDLVKWLPDGNLEYVGRVDDQVKIRGFRIELGEIQMQLEEHPDVRQAVVLAQENSVGEKQLVAYVVKIDKISIDVKVLREFLGEFLPYYMIPAVFIFLDEIPVNTNGKVDKNKLPDQSRGQIASHSYVAPATEAEKTLAKQWCDILNLKQIGVNDNFYEIGGNSLSSLEVLSFISEQFSIEVPLRTFLKHPTIEQLANVLQLLSAEKAALASAAIGIDKKQQMTCLIPLKPNGIKKPLFLIHPIGGTVFWYIPIVKYLDVERPLYGIQDPGVERTEMPFETMEELAKFYIENIRSVQPQGPYLIGGASGGAIITVEVVRQLRSMGEKIDFVGLLDGWAPFPDILHNQAFFEANMCRQYREMQQQFLAKGIKKADVLLKLQWERSRMIAKYNLPILDEKMTLFKALETMTAFQPIEAPLNHWEGYSTQPVELHMVPGDHETMFQEPHVQTLAQRLNDCLNEKV